MKFYCHNATADKILSHQQQAACRRFNYHAPGKEAFIIATEVDAYSHENI